MGRKKKTINRPILPDPRFGNVEVSKFINRMMWCGKKSTSQQVFYDAMDIIKEKLDKEPLEVFKQAMKNTRPEIEVRSRRVGGATYQVPVEVRTDRANALAMRWLIKYSRDRKGQSMAKKLSAELMDAYKNTGSAIKKREDTHKMADANKAFAHFKW